MTNKQNYIIRSCPICGNTKLPYLFSINHHRVVQCNECDLLALNPQPSDEELNNIYRSEYFLGSRDGASNQHVTGLKKATAENYLKLLAIYGGKEGTNLLEVGCGRGEFLLEAVKYGYNVTGVESSLSACKKAQSRLKSKGTVICGQLDTLANEHGKYDVCVLSDLIEHVRDPKDLLLQIHRLLRPNGIIFIATPSTDSWSAKCFKGNWMEFKLEHLFYFNSSNLQSLLFHCGFNKIITKPGIKTMNMDYITDHFYRYHIPVISWIVGAAWKFSPAFLRRKTFQIVPSGIIMMGRAQEKREKRMLSIIIPAFNEAATLETLLTMLLKKKIDDVDIEIILVESNSSDGTREIALKHKDNQCIKVVLEDKPRGKGHAVRTGLQHITGDFVLIQDADLEYELEDYDVLLEPLFIGSEAFVLGARHGGRAWKLRQFKKSFLSASLLYCGHLIFLALVNVFFGLLLKDPFTMFKVFRRDCLYGLTFECNRFDFDFELLIKLVRKGYKPIEIPVNYKSRSFKEGKKISIFRDPWTWIRAMLKYRFVKIDPLREMDKIAFEEADAPKEFSGRQQ